MVASLYTALLSYQRGSAFGFSPAWFRERPGVKALSVVDGRSLSIYIFTRGIEPLSYLPKRYALAIMQCDSLTEDVLLREVPMAFGLQNTSRLRMLSLSGTHNLHVLTTPPSRDDTLHGKRPRLIVSD